jgi:hypothetical protein
MNAAQVKMFHDACRTVLREAKDPYAKSYAQAGLTLASADAIKTQCLYIMSNLATWRGDEARKTKAVFVALSK